MNRRVISRYVYRFWQQLLALWLLRPEQLERRFLARGWYWRRR